MSINRRGIRFSANSETEPGKLMRMPPQAPSLSNTGGNDNNNDTSNFECNICLDLAQDPILTLCGHLFCWPCLYKWLHIHSQSQECPVCKAMIQEPKLVPLYGRGENSSDPRSKSFPSVDIPRRPAGQRPATAPPAPPLDTNYFGTHGFGFAGESGPRSRSWPTARSGNFTFAATFGDMRPWLLNLQERGYPDAATYGAGPTNGFPYGSGYLFHRGHAQAFFQCMIRALEAEYFLKMMFLLVGVLAILGLTWN